MEPTTLKLLTEIIQRFVGKEKGEEGRKENIASVRCTCLGVMHYAITLYIFHPPVNYVTFSNDRRVLFPARKLEIGIFQSTMNWNKQLLLIPRTNAQTEQRNFIMLSNVSIKRYVCTTSKRFFKSENVIVK